MLSYIIQMGQKRSQGYNRENKLGQSLVYYPLVTRPCENMTDLFGLISYFFNWIFYTIYTDYVQGYLNTMIW